MKRGDIKRKGNSFVVMVLGKNKTEAEEAPLSRDAVAAIDAWLAGRTVPSGYIFTSFDGAGHNETGQHISAVGAWKAVRKYADRCGLENIKPHDFRRFVGTTLAKKDIRQAQRALRHERLETTARHYVLDELEPGLTEGLF